MPGLSISLFEQLVLVIFVVSAFVQILYNFRYYLRFYLRQRASKSTGSETPPVSVIICARNEAENLRLYLPLVLEQDYPDFEVIVVNDCSEDDTEDVLNILSREHDKLRIATIHKDSSLIHSKKMALFIGIKAARNEILLLTDADCSPESPGWIRKMAGGFTETTDFVLGYGGYFHKPGLLNRYIRFETMFIAMQYMGMAIAGKPYMGVGRNLAYRRSIFFKNRGFGAHMNLQSGDDDLFVNSLANRNNCVTETDALSFTRSVPASTFISYSKQKMRHLSSSVHYPFSSRLRLAAEPLARILFWISSIVLLAGLLQPTIVIPIFSLTFISRIIVLSFAQKALNERDLLLISPLFDIASPILNAIFLMGSRMNKHQSYEWK